MKRLIALFALILGVGGVVFCQTDPVLPLPIDPNAPGGLQLDVLLDWTNALYGAIVIGIGYLSNKLPGLKLITNTAWRVAAIGLVAGMAFILAGKGFFPLLISYTVSTNFYSLFLSLFKKTPPVVPAKKK